MYASKLPPIGGVVWDDPTVSPSLTVHIKTKSIV